MNILISAGPTREAIDPVRFLTNRSSGKMGYAIAEAAVNAGHHVTLVSGPVTLESPPGLSEFVPVESAAQMAEAVKSRFNGMGLTIMCAAVADYRPAVCHSSKLKKSEGNLILELERTEDILKTLGSRKQPNQILVGFAAETDQMRSHAMEKLKQKNLDWIVANQVGVADRGFASDNNAATLFGRDGTVLELPLMSKSELAHHILSAVVPVR